MDVVSGDYLAEASGHFFIHRIGDGIRRALLILRQVAGRERPLVVLAGFYSQRLNSFIALLDVDRDALGHKGCVITLHIPGLFAANLYGLQRVGNGGSGHNLCESGRDFFVHSVFDFSCAVRTVLRQFLGCKLPLAVFAGLHGQGVDSLVAVLDVHCDLLGQQTCVITLQVPDLLAADKRGLRHISVLDVVSGNDLAEAFRYLFIHRVVDDILRALLVLRQILGRVGPLVVRAGGYGQRLNCRAAVLNVDRDAFGHQFFAVALHIPGLLAADLHCLQCVRDLRTIDHLAEARYFFFIYCVDDLCLAVRTVLRQFLGGEAPLAVFAGLHGQGVDSLVAVLDVHCDLLGQQTCVITLQVPDLFAPDDLCLQIICNDRAINTFVKSIRNNFIDGVVNQRFAVIGIHREFFGCEFPVVVLSGSYS